MFYNQAPRPIPPDTYLPAVDYQSELRLTVHTNELRLPTVSSVLPPLTSEQKARLVALQDLLIAGTNYLRAYASFQAQYAALKDKPFRTQDVAQLTQAIKQQANAGLTVVTPLKNYIVAKVAEQNPSASRKEALDQIALQTGRILPPGKALDLPALAEFVATESSQVLSQAVADAKTVQQNGSTFLRMRATTSLAPGQPPIPIHIRNYDTIVESNVVQEPRISFTMSDQDRQRLTTESKVNSDLANFITDLRAGHSDINKSLDSLLPALRSDLKNWKQSASDLAKLQSKLETVYLALVPAAEATNLTIEQHQLLVDMTNTWRLATNMVQQVRASVESVLSSSSPETDPTALLLQTADSISGVITNLTTLPILAADILTNMVRLRDLTAELATNSAAALTFQSLTNVLAKVTPSTEESIENLIQLTLAKYPNLVAEIRHRTGQGNQLLAASKMPPIESDPSLLDVPLSTPPDGFISLKNNIPKAGVTLQLDAALVTRKDTNAPPTATPLDHLEFDIEKFGVLNTWSANLIFVERLGNLPPNEQQVHFAPAPSLSWTLHYNPAPTPTRHQPSWFWHTLDPGAGLNIAALSWNSGLQVGTGAHISFFHDLVTLGGGYNLQASSHGGYVFVGLGLFAAFNQIGLSNSLGR